MTSADHQTAIEAILTANGTYSTETQSGAIEWLEQFMTNDSSWAVWRQLLHHETTQVRFFAANALTQKIRLHWNTLDHQGKGELKDELIEFCYRIIGEPAFQDRVALCLSAIAVRAISDEWVSFWQDMAEIFERGYNPDQSTPSSHASLGTSCSENILTPQLYNSRMTVLLILASLPGELEKASFPEQKASATINALKEGTDVLLQAIEDVMKLPDEKPRSHSGRTVRRSGSAPANFVQTGPTSPSTFLHPASRSASWDKQNAIFISTHSLKQIALNALNAWVSSSALSSGSSLRSHISARGELLPALFDAMTKPKLADSVGEILLLLFTRRSQAEVSSNGSTSTKLSSAFTPASRMTQASLALEDPSFISGTINQLLGLVHFYRDSTAPFVEAKEQGALNHLTEDEDLLKLSRSIVLLFVGFGEANVTLISHSLSVPLVREFLDVLLEMTSHPVVDIAELGMQFWNSLEYNLWGNPDFVPYYEHLLKNVLQNCMYPSGEGFDTLLDSDFDDDELYHFRIMRDSAVQTLRACYAVIGDHFLNSLAELVDQVGQSGSYDSSQWRLLELAYYAATTVNLHVPKVAPLISQLFNIALSLPIDLSQQTRTSHVKSKIRDEVREFSIGHSPGQSDRSTSLSSSTHTLSACTTPNYADRTISQHDLEYPPVLLVGMVRFLGDYRHWIMQQEDAFSILEPSVQLCLHWATAPNSELAFAASIAFKELCLASSSLLTPHLSTLVEKYATYYPSVRSEDRVTLAAGLGFLWSNLSTLEEMAEALQFIWNPSIAQLLALLDRAASEEAYPELINALCAELEILDASFTISPATVSPQSAAQASTSGSLYSSHPGAPIPIQGIGSSMMEALQSNEVFSLLDRVTELCLALNDGVTQVVEHLCTVYCTIVSSCQEAFESYVPAVTEKILSLFHKSTAPCCLQALSTAISQFGTSAEQLYVFSKAFLESSQIVYQEASLELLWAYFDLCSTVLSTNPSILVQSNGGDVLTSLVQVCLHTTTLEDPSMLLAGMTVLDKVMFGRQSFEREAWKQFVASLVERCGPEMLETLLKYAIHTSHRKSQVLLTTIIHRLIQTFQSMAKETLEQILSRDELPGNLSFTADEQERIVQIFLQLRSSLHFREFFNDFIDVANNRAETSIFNTYDEQITQYMPYTPPGTNSPDMNSPHGGLLQITPSSPPVPYASTLQQASMPGHYLPLS